MPKFYRIFLRSLYTLIIYINNKYRQQFTLFFLLLPVTRYQHVFRDCEIGGLPEKQNIRNAVFQALRTCFVLFTRHQYFDLYFLLISTNCKKQRFTIVGINITANYRHTDTIRAPQVSAELSFSFLAVVL